MNIARSSSVDERIDWLRKYESEAMLSANVPVQKVFSYIDFKLTYDFAFSDGNYIDITEDVAIDYFLGLYNYEQVRRDFHRNAIVFQVESERLYFGSRHVSKKRMRRQSVGSNKEVFDFDIFTEILEKRLFKKKLVYLDRHEKETLGVILRIINQGVSAVAMRMFKAWLRVNSGKFNVKDFADEGGLTYLMRPDCEDEKGSTQIDIIVGEDKIQLSRREYVTVQEFDPESLLDPDAADAEKWSLLTLITRNGPSGSSDWHLHFSTLKTALPRNERAATVPNLQSSSVPARNEKSYASLDRKGSIFTIYYNKLIAERFKSKAKNELVSDIFKSGLTELYPENKNLQNNYNSVAIVGDTRPEPIRKRSSKMKPSLVCTTSTIYLPESPIETPKALKSASNSEESFDSGQRLHHASSDHCSESVALDYRGKSEFGSELPN